MENFKPQKTKTIISTNDKKNQKSVKPKKALVHNNLNIYSVENRSVMSWENEWGVGEVRYLGKGHRQEVKSWS